MSRRVTRRDFVATTALAALAIPGAPRLRFLPGLVDREPGADGEASLAVQPFDLAQVRLRPGTFQTATDICRRFMTDLEPDRLLHMFRVTAGLPSSAQPLGGWEAPVNELRGHMMGHYLSACALMSRSTGDTQLKRRGDELVAELAKCQSGNGYLMASPEELFDRLRDGKPAWAPFYTMHKIMAGMVDMHTLAGNAQALDVVRKMANWVRGWQQPLSDAHMARVLEREYGGMNDVLYNLSAVTGDESYRELAHRFDHQRFFAPLADHRDELKGLHVNTQIPKIIGAARHYELTGDAQARTIAEFFWHTVTENRAYCTGGTSNGEGWGADPGKLSGELSGYTQECCVTYNMLKLSRHLFQWTADPRVADYYERAMFNGILGTQHPSDGMTLYYVPLASGYWKLFGLPRDAFWCCTGSGLESFSKLGDSIYFHDDAGIYVNLFIASEVSWPDRKGGGGAVRLVQETNFPEEETTRLTVHAERPVQMPLRIRVPYWATSGGTVKLNGKPLESYAAPSSYFVLNRTWRDGDTVEVTMPMRLHTHPMPDDGSVIAMMYGPVVLAGRLGTAGLTPEKIRAEPTKPRTIPEYKLDPVPAPAMSVASGEPATWVKPVPGKPLEFETQGQKTNVKLSPLYKVIDERYAVYWKTT